MTTASLMFEAHAILWQWDQNNCHSAGNLVWFCKNHSGGKLRPPIPMWGLTHQQ